MDTQRIHSSASQRCQSGAEEKIRADQISDSRHFAPVLVNKSSHFPPVIVILPHDENRQTMLNPPPLIRQNLSFASACSFTCAQDIPASQRAQLCVP